jgi:sirohydrochlorin cobaltochelatase
MKGAQDTLLLMGHGSRDADGVAEFLLLVEAIRGAAPRLRVEAGFLEFAGPLVPSIDDAIDACAARGGERVLAVPMLLAEAVHGREDMPALVAAARARYPALDLRLAPVLGPHLSLIEIVEERIAAMGGDPEDTTVLLVGRGTSSSGANADIYRLGRLLWERNRYAEVECCFSGTAQPDVPTGIDRCIRLGARRVVLAPYLINTGSLVKRIGAQAAEARIRHPAVQIDVAGHIGLHPKLVELVVARARGLIEDVAPDPSLDGRGWRYPRGHAHEHPHAHTHHHGDHAATSPRVGRGDPTVAASAIAGGRRDCRDPSSPRSSE